MNGILYHYTNYMAFNGIIVGNELRLNNVLNMNDASEMKYFMDTLCKEIIEQLNIDGKRGLSGYVTEMFRNETENVFGYSAYAACFSEYGDDAAQWERYGNRGKGVCIGFDEKLLKKMTGGPLSLNKVKYTKDVKERRLVEKFVALLHEYDEVGEDLQDNWELFGKSFSELMRQAWSYSAAYKHPSFRSEEEVRLVLSPHGVDYFNIEPLYHVSQDRIKKYYPLDIRKMCEVAGINHRELIVSIRTGPETKQSTSILKDYLGDNGCRHLVDRILISECPLRTKPLD